MRKSRRSRTVDCSISRETLAVAQSIENKRTQLGSVQLESAAGVVPSAAVSWNKFRRSAKLFFGHRERVSVFAMV